jgi:hypothetical protein
MLLKIKSIAGVKFKQIWGDNSHGQLIRIQAKCRIKARDHQRKKFSLRIDFERTGAPSRFTKRNKNYCSSEFLKLPEKMRAWCGRRYQVQSKIMRNERVQIERLGRGEK